MSKANSLLYGIIGCLGLIFLSLPQVERFILFGGLVGTITEEVISIISTIGYYGILIFSLILIKDALKSLRGK